MRGQNGFTLIELMIVAAVVALLASLAIPGYTQYVMRGKIAEATANLSDMRVRAEQFFQDNRTYIGYPCTSAARYFTHTCPTLTATTYTIQAAGVAAQGMGGFTYTINQANGRATTAVPAGWTASATCWVIRKDGSC